MKRYLLVFAAVLCALCSCTKTATDIILDTNQVLLYVGETQNLHATIIPSDADNQLVYWSTSDSGVATVTNGLIKAITPGEATVTVRTDDGGFSASCHVVVKSNRVPVDAIFFDKTSISLFENENDTITVAFSPDTASNKDLIWSSSDESIAKVVDGIVFAVKADTSVVQITAVSVDNPNQSATCDVSVGCKVAGVILNAFQVIINEKETYQLNAIVYPSRASNLNLKWSSSDESVAIVSETGLITAVNVGTAIISVETEDGGLKYDCELTVRSPVSDLLIDKKELLMFVGDSDYLTATIQPDNASNKKINWTSDDPTILSISADGSKCLVKATRPGTACVHATTAEGGIIQTCKVTVVRHVTGLKLDKTFASIYEGSVLALVPEITPEDAYVKDLQWTSSDETVATVVDGQITAVSKGKAVITATSVDVNTIVATCDITVLREVTSVIVDKELVLSKGGKGTLSFKVEPEGADYSSFRWESEGDAVKVGQNGEVTALKSGDAFVWVVVNTSDKEIKSNPCSVEIHAVVEGIKFEKSEILMAQYDELYLPYTILPVDAYNTNVTISSSNPKVVFVNPVDGKVTALSSGVADITVKTEDGGYTDVCHVTVKKFVDRIVLDNTLITIEAGKTATLTAKIEPSDAADKDLVWSSSNPSVATVTQEGLVKALSSGEAIISVSTLDGGITATCKILVINYVGNVSISLDDPVLYKGEWKSFSMVITPADAQFSDVTWISSDASVATVDNKGVVTAVKVGKTSITAIAYSNNNQIRSNSYEVEVRSHIEGIALGSESLSLVRGEQKQLTCTLSPSDAYNRKVKWTSSNPAVATVSALGLVDCKSVGTANITAETEDGGFKAICSVTVHSFVTGIKFDNTSLTIDKGMSKSLNVTISPEDAENKVLEWKSSNTAVATVSDGRITAVAPGTATVTATATDGSGKTAQCVITVPQYVESVSISPKTLSMSKGETKKVYLDIAPANALYSSINWKSDNSNVKVEPDGNNSAIVTALQSGEATVKAIVVSGAESISSDPCLIDIKSRVESVKLDKEDLSMLVGEHFDLIATVLPKDAFNKNVKWSSTNINVADVTLGYVECKSVGKTDIVVETEDGGKTAVCHLTVISRVTGIRLNKQKITLGTQETFTLDAEVTPADASNKTLEWTSSDESVATVSENGVVTAVSKGNATITASSTDGSAIKAQCSVSVITYVKSVTLSPTEKNIKKGESVNCAINIEPAGADYSEISWPNYFPDILDIVVSEDSKSAVVTSKAPGTASIIVKVLSHGDEIVSNKCTLTIVYDVEGIKLDKKALDLEVGQTAHLTSTVLPENASNKEVSWRSTDSNVASVSQNGDVVAKSSGTANIIVETQGGSFSDTCVVTVHTLVKSIILNAANIELNVGKTRQIEATINPSTATNKTLSWSSDDPNVASVDANGLITAVSAGSAIITAKATDGSNVSQSCIVKVTIIPVSAVTVTPSTLRLNEKESSQLSADVTPSNAGDKTVTWKSSNLNVATVDATGKVTAVGAGTVTISAISNQNQAASGYCVVTVVDNSVKVTGVTLNASSKIIEMGRNFKLLAVVTPSDATNKNLTWTSSNDAVVTVDQNGNVIAMSKGSAIITATSNNGITASCTFEVVDQIIPVTGVNISDQTLELYIGDKYQLHASVTPYNATYTGITWDTSVGSSVTCVNGLVTALKEGSANVFAISEGTDSDGDHRNATCLVTVKKHNVDTIVFSDNSRKLKVGDKITMKATAYCNDNGSLIDPSVPGVTWSSSNSSVATIDRNTGELVAKSKGTVTITATSVDYISTVVGLRFTSNTCVIEVVDGTVGKGGTEDLEFKKLF